jgi:hypothetical protein
MAKNIPWKTDCPDCVRVLHRLIRWTVQRVDFWNVPDCHRKKLGLLPAFVALLDGESLI